MKESTLRDPSPLSAEEYLILPEEDVEWTELVRGEVVREPPPFYGHGLVAGNLFYHLRRFVEEHRLGRVVGEAGFVVERGPDTVRGPDVSYLSSERIAAQRRREGYFEGAPDLAVEVLSKGNTRREMARKIGEYLAAGARQVWIVDPVRRTVTVHARHRPSRVFTSTDHLDGGDLLPGFSLPVCRIFEE